MIAREHMKSFFENSIIVVWPTLLTVAALISLQYAAKTWLTSSEMETLIAVATSGWSPMNKLGVVFFGGMSACSAAVISMTLLNRTRTLRQAAWAILGTTVCFVFTVVLAFLDHIAASHV